MMEVRTIDGHEFEVREQGDNQTTLSGYAAVFGQQTTIHDRLGESYIEEIAPGAFKRSLQSGKEIFALRNHDMNVLLGSTKVNLKLWEDGVGLRFELSGLETPEFRSALSAVKTRLLRHCSFGFRIPEKGDKWSMRGDTPHRSLVDVDLGEVTLTHIPAYSHTSVEVRSLNIIDKPEVKEDPINEERYQYLRQTYGK